MCVCHELPYMSCAVCCVQGILASKAEEVAGHVGRPDIMTAAAAVATVLDLKNTSNTGSNAATTTAVPSTPGSRTSVLKPLQMSVAALPEATGLPYDDSYAYLCLLRRYVLYGPSLGMTMSTTGYYRGGSITGSIATAPLSHTGSLVV